MLALCGAMVLFNVDRHINGVPFLQCHCLLVGFTWLALRYTVYCVMTPIRIRIREIRKSLGLSQAELSKRTGIRQATISAIENGHTAGIDFDTLEALADVFEVDPAVLIKRVRE